MALDAVKPTTLRSTEDDWADATDDDDDGDEAPTVHVDSLDLTALSINDKNKDRPAAGKHQHHPVYNNLTWGEDGSPATSLADRISMGSDETKKAEDKGKEVVKVQSVTTIAPATTTGAEGETRDEKKDVTPQDTNLIHIKYEVAVKLQDMQADPNSPLYSVKSFEELGLYLLTLTVFDARHPNLLKGIYAMKFQKPSKVQERALPLLVANPYPPPKLRF
jgi:ATP-dependent RNA helicase DDX19/DBP5